MTDMATRLGGADRRLRGARALDAQAVAEHGARFAARRARRELALADAGLLGEPRIRDGRMGVACGSSRRQHAGHQATLSQMLQTGANRRAQRQFLCADDAAHRRRECRHLLRASRAASFRRRSACTSGSQGIGYAYEAIKPAARPCMLAGGAEELCPSEAIAFDILYATSRRNDAADTRRRDPTTATATAWSSVKARACWFSKSSSTRARAGRRIHAEVVGFASNSDGAHVTTPEGGNDARRHGDRARRCRGLGRAIGYVNGHGTATEHGDIAESRATSRVFGSADRRSARRRATSATRSAPAARSRPGSPSR